MTMSHTRYTLQHIRRKKGSEPIVCLTAYSATTATLIDPHVDMILVGDSVGMVLYGMKDTLGVTLNMMCQHGSAVVNHSSHACVVVDMPFASYQSSPETAFLNAARIMTETGCQAVKLEGGAEMAETISFLTKRGIPVVGHVGLMPQMVHIEGGYRSHGKTPDEEKKILRDAQAVEQAGALTIVLEGVVRHVAEEITTQLNIPTIGIGASPHCDGQVLVTEDIIGLSNGHIPSFVKQYASVREEISRAAASFSSDVRNGLFANDMRDVKQPQETNS